ncbi:MAG: GNAT family N-acetyltransferase [Chloroflexota bacterium]
MLDVAEMELTGALNTALNEITRPLMSGNGHNQRRAAPYSLRPATMDDAQAVVDVANAYSLVQHGAAEEDVEDMQVHWATPGFDLGRDVRVAVAADGRVVGFLEIWDPNNPHVTIRAWGRVHPDYQGQGVGRQLLGWAEQRARQSIPLTPDGARVVLHSHAPSTDAAAHILFEQSGFTLIRHSWRMLIEMETAPLEPVWPAGITWRTLVVGQDERVAIQAVQDSFQDHWGYVARPLDEELQVWRHFMTHDPLFDPSLWFLAMYGDQVAGVSLCWPPRPPEDPEMGWLGTLGVRRPWRKQGLGLALLYHTFGEFYRRGHHKVGLGVDASNLTGATRLYEKAGMRVARQYDLYEKELRPGVDLTTQTL